MQIDSVKLNPANPRKNDETVEAVVKSIKAFGYTNPILVRRDDGVVIAGHTRVKALKQLGFDKVPVVYLDLSETDAKAYMLTDNKLTENTEWDFPKLADLFVELDGLNVDLDLTGFSADEIADFVAPDFGDDGEDDSVPEPPKEATTKTGDLWRLGKHRLLCGDCTVEDNVKRLMDGKKAEILFTSPPYSDMRDYGGNDLSVDVLVRFISAFSSFTEYQIINLGLKRKDNEIVQYWDEYIQEAKKAGYVFLSWNVWSRRGMGGSIANMSAMFRMEHEWIFVFGKSRKKLNRTQRNKSAGSHTGITNRQKDGTTKKAKPKIVKDYGRLSSVTEMCYGNSEEHPAVFPVVFPVEYINAMTSDGQIVIDPFLGSGTTLIACEKTGRICYGMEIDPIYCDVIVKRWEQYTGEKAELLKG